jgi:hypothetical protein
MKIIVSIAMTPALTSKIRVSQNGMQNIEAHIIPRNGIEKTSLQSKQKVSLT